MPQHLTDEQLESFRNRLQTRLAELTREVREEVIRSGHHHFTDIAGEVHDSEEASVANLVIDMELQSIDRHIQEIREIESALIRIGSREFGICVDCEQPIALARLEANPTTERCIACQSAYEKEQALTYSPSL
ncbi:TraR/DksA family transcriptional regulator [Methylocaldum szegediense]|uniref:DnaK suppressor protein n=1 Tax=Methylocaldum szegediense TaxID=73780 RepID=A0ABN8WXF7_9GAMM|nr:TraR/DksA family transcriptional regulator [Methylocaldum szegediense]CAI8743083.1 DnaK suppressor protein [Methylocaldum szegediense]